MCAGARGALRAAGVPEATTLEVLAAQGVGGRPLPVPGPRQGPRQAGPALRGSGGTSGKAREILGLGQSPRLVRRRRAEGAAAEQ